MSLREDAAARLAFTFLVLIGIAMSLMTFLIISQAQILSVINVIMSASLPGGPLYNKPLATFVAINCSIQIFAGTNTLTTIGVALNQLFFGTYWWMNYAANSLLISYLIQILGRA
ncbi:MAG: hypothetical protein QXV37_00715 [Candidatus Jordarchaeaceae archaeon]